MALTVLFLIVSCFVSAFINYWYCWYEKWYMIIISILLIPVLYLLCFGIYIIIVFFASLFMNKKKQVKNPSKVAYFFVKHTIRQLVLLSNTKVHVTGLDKLPKDERFLIISNHVSMFDPIVVVDRFKIKHIICVTKPENKNIPICGPFIHKAGFIAIDRENNHNAIHSIRQASDYIKTGKYNVYICPEGTRSKTGEMLEFHAGSFKIATRAECGVAICSIKNTNMISKNFPFKRTHVYLDVLDFVSKEEVQELRTVDLSNKAFNIIKAKLEGEN